MSSPTPNRLWRLDARETLDLTTAHPLWRLTTGALRIDSAAPGQDSRFVRLALPGDVVGVEVWAGTHDPMALRSLIPSTLVAVDPQRVAMMPLLMETVVVAHQRCREVVSLRSGPATQRIQALLLLFAQAQPGNQGPLAQCAVPSLADLSDIIDAAPETVSRVFASLRDLNVLQSPKRQQASFSRQALASLEQIAGLSAPKGPRRPVALAG
jgi:CRP-like cAMP-binding protein